MSIPDRNSQSDLRSLISNGGGGAGKGLGATAGLDLRKLIRTTNTSKLKSRSLSKTKGGKAGATGVVAAALAAVASGSKSKKSSSSNGAKVDLRKALKKANGAGVIKKSTKQLASSISAKPDVKSKPAVKAPQTRAASAKASTKVASIAAQPKKSTSSSGSGAAGLPPSTERISLENIIRMTECGLIGPDEGKALMRKHGYL